MNSCSLWESVLLLPGRFYRRRNDRWRRNSIRRHFAGAWTRRAPVGFTAFEQAIDQRRGAGLWIPAKPQHRDLHGTPTELQRFVAAPQVEIQQSSLDGRTGVHHGVDATVFAVANRHLDDAADRQQLRVGGGDAAANAHA